MKTAAAIIVFLALLAQCSNGYIAVLNYQVNQQFITRERCINRDNPVNYCKGRCYLKKQLAKTRASESGSSRRPAYTVGTDYTIAPTDPLSMALVANQPPGIYSRYRLRNAARIFPEEDLRPPGMHC
jgi:hypothetical protein